MNPILHIPHASTEIPARYRDQFVLSEEELELEARVMGDLYTDELFEGEGRPAVRFPASRLVVDVERFRDDSQEPMSAGGLRLKPLLQIDSTILRSTAVLVV